MDALGKLQHVTVNADAEGRPMAPDEFKRLRLADPAAFARRGEIYTMLREAGDHGITGRDLESLGFGSYELGIHIESLMLEGHRITRSSEHIVARATYTYRWVLTHDAWADQPVRAAGGDPEADGPEEEDVGAPERGVPEEAPRAGEASPDGA